MNHTIEKYIIKFYDAAMHDLHAVMRDEMERKLLYLQSARSSVLTGGGQ